MGASDESWRENAAINRNMGCIEMIFVKSFKRKHSQINRNMGCIEILINTPKFTDDGRDKP